MKSLPTILLICILMVSCNSGGKSAGKGDEANVSAGTSAAEQKNIPYRTAANYFVKNNIQEAVPTKISTRQEFDKYFGAVATMGENGAPTKIDFSKEFLIVVDHAITDKETAIDPVSLTEKEGGLALNYRVKEGAAAGFSMRPVLLLIVENSYKGNGTVKATRVD